MTCSAPATKQDVQAVLDKLGHLHTHLLTIEGKVDELMSAISDFATATKAHLAKVDAGLAGLATDIKALNAKITELQNSPGTVTAADQALLDELQAMAKTLGEKADALDALTPPPVPPIP